MTNFATITSNLSQSKPRTVLTFAASACRAAECPAEPAQQPAPVRLPFCVISSNQLASKYLLNLLTQDSLFCPIAAEDIVQQTAEIQTPLFVIYHSQLTLPLSECIGRIKAKIQPAYFLVVGAEQDYHEVLHILSLGVHGYVAEQQSEDMLLPAARTVVAGGFWVPEGVFQAQLRPPAANIGTRLPESGVTPVTAREAHVLELVRRRFSNKEIANVLNICESTVKYHLSNLFGKLHVTSRHELVQAEGMPASLGQVF